MFANRIEAGRRLADLLEDLRDTDPVVVGLPRGGVPVAAEVARALCAPLDVIVVRKLGVPFHPELGMGAIGEGGVRVLNTEIMRLAHVTAHELARVEQRERGEVDRRARRFRGDLPRIPLAGRTVIVVDDGIATGSTARAACRVARAQGPARVVLAVPVAPREWVSRVGDDADDYVCLETPDDFYAVGQFYTDFSQTTDDEVVECLVAAAAKRAESSACGQSDDPPERDEDVEIQAGSLRLSGHLAVPADAVGIVVFAHGSGSSRHSPRNRYVASILNQAGLGTLLFDLLTVDEEVERSSAFDIALLGRRLVDTTRWLRAEPDLAALPIAYFGASTGAAAALWAAAEPGVDITAIVSRGGRPDLAGQRLPVVRAPTLLIVGSRDEIVLDLNRRARSQMRGETDVAVVPGATHLFEEPGTLATVAALARDWFVAHLTMTADRSATSPTVATDQLSVGRSAPADEHVGSHGRGGGAQLNRTGSTRRPC